VIHGPHPDFQQADSAKVQHQVQLPATLNVPSHTSPLFHLFHQG
jgi:hypothetical protein